LKRALRAGIAKALLQTIISRLRGTITLNVAKSNQAACRLYEQLGFEIEREFTGNFEGHELPVMRLRYGQGT